MPTDRSIGHVWRPVRDLDPRLTGYAHEAARWHAKEWRERRLALENREFDRRLMDRWLAEQKRAFAIETGQVENLYLLRQGVTETLISEGFEGVRGAYSVTRLDDDTLSGLLEDQEAALEMVFSHVKDERPLNVTALKEWHALLTRHQDSATGIHPLTGKRVAIPLIRGDFKIRSNDPRVEGGHVHEYCPPERTRQQVELFLEMHEGHAGLDLSPEIEAAWMHHEFARIHPFQDGNGRVSRLLMAMPYIKAGEFPPIVTNMGKIAYYQALQAADNGRLDTFARYLGGISLERTMDAVFMADEVLAGERMTRTMNGGFFHVDRGYSPPPEVVLDPDQLDGAVPIDRDAGDRSGVGAPVRDDGDLAKSGGDGFGDGCR